MPSPNCSPSWPRCKGNELGIDELAPTSSAPAPCSTSVRPSSQKPRPRFKRCSNDSASKTRTEARSGLPQSRFLSSTSLAPWRRRGHLLDDLPFFLRDAGLHLVFDLIHHAGQIGKRFALPHGARILAVRGRRLWASCTARPSALGHSMFLGGQRFRALQRFEQAGMASMFSARTVHGSPRNSMARPRLILVLGAEGF